MYGSGGAKKRPGCLPAEAFWDENPKKDDRDENRTRNLWDWNPTRCHCATQSSFWLRFGFDENRKRVEGNDSTITINRSKNDFTNHILESEAVSWCGGRMTPQSPLPSHQARPPLSKEGPRIEPHNQSYLWLYPSTDIHLPSAYHIRAPFRIMPLFPYLNPSHTHTHHTTHHTLWPPGRAASAPSPPASPNVTYWK